MLAMRYPYSSHARGVERMGRLVTAISYAQNSPFDYIMKEMKRHGKNVSHTIVDIMEHHYELYNQVQSLTEQVQHQAQQHSAHREAALTAGLHLYAKKDDLGGGTNVLAWVYKNQKGETQYQFDGLIERLYGGEEE
jgi:hypothetical protein